jgi:hypothetical protein
VVEYDLDNKAAADIDIGNNIIKTSSIRQVLIVISASARNRIVGRGGIVYNTAKGGADDIIARSSVTLSPRDKQNAYTAKLEAIAVVLRCLTVSNIER